MYYCHCGVNEDSSFFFLLDCMNCDTVVKFFGGFRRGEEMTWVYTRHESYRKHK